MISDFHYNIIIKNKERLDSAIVYDRDFKYNYFGFKTLERSYLLKINNKVNLLFLTSFCQRLRTRGIYSQLCIYIYIEKIF